MKNAKQLVTKKDLHSITDKTIIGFVIGSAKAFVMKEDYFDGKYTSIAAHKIHLHNSYPTFRGQHVVDVVELLLKEDNIVYSFKNESCLLRWLAAKH